jgi:hypothetical protein
LAKLTEKKDYEAALLANDLVAQFDANPLLLYNRAELFLGLDRKPEALDNYKKFLAAGDGGRFGAETARAREMESKLQQELVNPSNDPIG